MLLRTELERAGLTCWMDVGQIGGGDFLYNQIYRGIYASKVVLCCLTPRSAVSDSCCKELSLADLLHKPVVPVMVEKTPWPPPGPMGLLMAQLIYTDLAGTYMTCPDLLTLCLPNFPSNHEPERVFPPCLTTLFYDKTNHIHLFFTNNIFSLFLQFLF